MINVVKKEQPESEIAAHTIIVKGTPLKQQVLTDIVIQKTQDTIKPNFEVNQNDIMFEIY